MKMISSQVDLFFETARERYRIRERRLAGQPWPWTEDKIFQAYSFCNVHREHDRTTMWFAENIRSKLSGQKAIEATVIFRWFNRIETGEKIKHLLLGEWDSEEAAIILDGVKPLVTGAYMIKTVTGMSKLDGAIFAIDNALPILRGTDWGTDLSLQEMHRELTQINYMGGFMAYEVVSDLRWTDVLRNASDIMSWANAGPGCARGMSRLVYGSPRGYFARGSKTDQEKMNLLMQELLDLSYDKNYWPSVWRQWEMREVEHWLCEFDKYVRAIDGTPLKRRYREGVNA